ncbi:MAG: hypothetical protein HY096_15945 [Nitrospinae bacterium]|nr:hypothetical protein [Nitrospinota bacterium]MBI5748947.1 hypothetical protein [Nitrospinota bacterium]
MHTLFPLNPVLECFPAYSLQGQVYQGKPVPESLNLGGGSEVVARLKT